MKRIIITESQYETLLSNKSIEDNSIEILKNLSPNDRELFLTILEYKYPNKLKKGIISESKNISESEWYNLVGDIAGIFDPTGIIDALNAVSYFSQGEVLFGMLSIVSVIPYIGDALAKPVVLGAKMAGPIIKPLNAALKTKQVPKIVASLNKIGSSGKFGENLIKFFKGFGDDVLKGIKELVDTVKNLPGGKQLSKLVDEWVSIFKETGKQLGKKVPNKVGSQWKLAGKTIKAKDAIKIMGKNFLTLITPLSGSGKAFRGVGNAKRFKGTTSLFSGASPLRNTLGYTKLWGHFLTFVFGEKAKDDVDGVLAKYGEKATGVEFQKFIDSPQGKKAVRDEFGEALKDMGEDAILRKLGI
tara:strand:+ start:2266 stop:3339 length:1074 start_codon:yes stop_codon:yes gene_type:complete